MLLIWAFKLSQHVDLAALRRSKAPEGFTQQASWPKPVHWHPPSGSYKYIDIYIYNICVILCIYIYTASEDCKNFEFDSGRLNGLWDVSSSTQIFFLGFYEANSSTELRGVITWFRKPFQLWICPP